MKCPTCNAAPPWTRSWATDICNPDICVAPGPRHRRLLASNDAPQEPDLPAIKSTISQTDARLACLGTEISRLRDHLAQLEDEHAAVLAFREQNTAILSPLRRLPPEVLGEIFAWTMPEVGDALSAARHGFDMNGSPWVLAQISSRWRAVALSIPALWSLVVINYSAAARYPLPMLDAQLSRAQRLKVHFYGSEHAAPEPQIELFRYLAARASFWEELSIGLTSHLVPLLSTIQHLPLLVRLAIQWEHPKSQAVVDSLTCFNAAPALLDVTVCNNYRPVPILLPMHQLTRYELDGPWATHHTLLSLAENLVEARIVIAFDPDPWPESQPGDQINLPRLQRLYVSDTAVLNYLQTPALQGLCLSQTDVDADADDLLFHLDTCLLRSACTLRRICFTGAPPEPYAVAEILQKNPTITELAVLMNSIPADAASALIARLAVPSPPLAPQLSKIEFGWWGRRSDAVLGDALFAMLASRWRAKECALKSAVLMTDWDESSTWDLSPVVAIAALQEEGLEVSMLRGAEGAGAMTGCGYGLRWA